MSLPLVEVPPQIRSLLSWYKNNFKRKQYKHFRNLITGLIASDKKTIQEINDCFGDNDQSSLNRFLTKSDWDIQSINDARIEQVISMCHLGKGILICDPTLLHKTGKHMEKVNYHYSGITKKKELGHCLVNSFYTDNRDNSFPVRSDIYIREIDADKEHIFKTTRQICLEQLDYAIGKLQIWLFMADAGLYADFLIQDIKARGLKYVIGIRTTNKVSIDGKKRISVEEYLNTLTDEDFNFYFKDGNAYFLHTKEIMTRGIGKEKLLISYKSGDEDTIKIYTTNLMNVSDETVMMLLLKRWAIECWHKDAKQNLGLEDYQVRKFGAIQKVVCAVLVAYTQIFLSKRPAILSPFKRTLNTIGEGCRFLRLIALKGWKWVKEKSKDIVEFSEILNNYVFVKNAKV
jgi:SRSO17 transposase